MGYIKHNAIIVTGRNEPSVIAAHAKAVEIFTKHFGDQIRAGRLISPIVSGIANSETSFFIAPDGSKEGWDPSTAADEGREEFLNWLHSEPGNYCDYIEVRFGGDDEAAYVIRDRDSDLKKP